MAYYGGRGDYYRGDYYRGDPLFGALIGALPGIVRVGKSLLGVGSKVKPILKGVGAAAGGAATAVTIGGAVKSTMPPPPGQIKRPGVRGTIQRALPGGQTGYMKRRRLNPTNPKALRRALRRVSGFAKLAQRTKRDIGKAATAAGIKRGVRRKK